ncbi:MAG: hypothetical protein IJO85_12240 [Lachnospiraceae bacterium]|nr:hypothetical protein [Lachnospiraceae bacterium]
MKRKMKKGRLLIILSLLLAMMMGMSVHAATYSVDNLAEGTILEPGDLIVMPNSGVYGLKVWLIDESRDGSVSNESGSYAFIVGEGEYFKVGTIETNVSMRMEVVNLLTYQPSTQTPTPAPDNNQAENTNDEYEEPIEEEPKETEEQIFMKELLTRVANAKAGDNMVIDATLWHSYSSKVLESLLNKEGVNYTFYYNYKGETFYITIPAGTALEEGCEWYGPNKLNAMFGRTMIDGKELRAAINK